MKRPCAIAAFLLALFSWQCQSPESPAVTKIKGPATMTPISSVAGPVIFEPEGTNDVIFMVDFPVTLKNGGGGESQTTKTDVTGRYRFSGVKPGKYTVCWEGGGWQSGCTPEVQVVAGQSASPQPVGLKPAAPGVIWGRVLLADGSPATVIDRDSATAETATVALLGTDQNSIANVRTDASGKYAIPVAGAAAGVRASSGTAQAVLKLTEKLAPGHGHDIVLNNHRPVISSVDVVKASGTGNTLMPGDTVKLSPHITDADGDSLQARWSAVAGSITSTPDGVATWQMPTFPAQVSAYLLVTDGKGGYARKTVVLSVGDVSLRLPIAIDGGPPSCTPLSLASVPAPSGYPPTPPFLTFLGTTDNSAAYYLAVDPQSKRTTLGAWWQVAGFNPSNGSGGVAKAAYLNFNDLGFGRDMHFNQVGNKIYAWVTNYGCPDNKPTNADLAANPIAANAVATVCMEYAPIEGATQSIVKFFVYVGGVAASTRTGLADLDEWGKKPVPNLCQECHGSESPYAGGSNVNLGSSFIPFDLALLRYPGGSKTPPLSDLASYYTMNQLVKQTNPTQAISNLIDGWYTPLLRPPSQNNNYIPTGWQTSSSVPASAAGLYQNVIVPGCRTCHYSFSPGSGINWDTYQSVLNDRGFIRSYVCRSGPVMPHAAVTYINFWTNPYPFPQPPPQFLGSYTDSNWPSYGGCTGH